MCASPGAAFEDGSPAQWNQFRGPAGSGVANIQVSPGFLDGRHLKWKTSIPGGQSSPIVWEDRIFLNAFDGMSKVMETLCVDRVTGKIVWRKAVPVEKTEVFHEMSSPAASTPVTDGERVYTYFGSYGFIAYAMNGDVAWTYPLPVAHSEYGSAASPVLAGKLLVFDREENGTGAMFAIDTQSGKLVWKTQHASGFRLGSYASPIIWNDQIIQHRYKEIAGFRLSDGKRLWWLPVPTSGTSTPVVINDILYVATWSGFGEADQIVEQPNFQTLLQRLDKDGDGKISQQESPKDFLIASRPDVVAPGSSVAFSFQRLDLNKDGFIDATEWTAFAGLAKLEEHGVIAVKLGGEGELPASRILWKEPKSIPEVPSPVLYNGRLYMVRNGGILTCLDTNTGKVVYRERIRAGGPYYSSLIAAGGLILASSFEGKMVVVRAGDIFEVVGRWDFDEPLQATPAAAYDTIFVRSAKHLYAFGGR